MTVQELEAMPLTELEALALQAKTGIARHYAGAKLTTDDFFKLKGIEIVYNLRSWAEADKAGPARLNKLAKKAAK